MRPGADFAGRRGYALSFNPVTTWKTDEGISMIRVIPSEGWKILLEPAKRLSAKRLAYFANKLTPETCKALLAGYLEKSLTNEKVRALFSDPVPSSNP